MTTQPMQRRPQPDSLADVLERVLDKGIVIAGDVVVNVLDIELLTLKLRLFIASADTAREMGMDWWTTDPFFNSHARAEALEDGGSDAQRQVGGGQSRRRTNRQLEDENQWLRQRLAALESGQESGQQSGQGQAQQR